MILLVDAGNTRVKWWVVDEAAQANNVAEGVFEHARIDELEHVVERFPAVTRMVGTNVAGDPMAERIARLLASRPITVEWVRASLQCCGVRNHYAAPTQLGADRWAALIGARALHHGACLVVSAGTATTVDLLDADGNFLGGLIIPGVDLMRHSLAGNTAQLPLSNGRFSMQPRCTADAIESGCLQAQAGAVERMFAQIAHLPDSCCLLGGGAAGRFADLLDLPLQKVDNLVLHGLAAMVREQRAS